MRLIILILALTLATPALASRSKIPELRWNHQSFSDTAGGHPSPIAMGGGLVYWDITAETERQAADLEKHIKFMSWVLKRGGTPRAWDGLFVIEAAMKDHIATNVEREGHRVVVNKVADNDCAYEIIKAHAKAVSEEFFNGDLSQDHTQIAYDIVALPACDEYRPQLEQALGVREL